MMNKNDFDKDTLWQRFPVLAQAATEPAVRALLRQASAITLPPRQPVFFHGAPCQRYLLVASGQVRVYLVAASGREVTLYHVDPGHACILTTACLLGHDAYPASAITVSEVTALAVDQGLFEQALNASAAFRRFVFADLGGRLSDVIRRMEDVAFGDFDQRLAVLLVRNGADGAQISLTHQELAAELGSAREVVSRHLKRFESRGWLRLGRGKIEIADRAALARLGGLQPLCD